MAVKRLRPRVPTAAKKPRRKVDRTPLKELALPTRRSTPSHSITDYTVLFYGPPKVGKTTLLCSFPDPIWAMTEPGKPGYPVFIFNGENGGITDWTIMRKLVDLLEQSDRFNCAVIDTLEEAYRMCQEWVCRQAGVAHPHDANDFGKTWDAITNEFRGVFNRILQTGRAIYMTSHAKETTIASASGRDYSKIGPSLTGKAGTKILALVDFIFYVDYFKVDGRDLRVVVTRGSELVTAGQRKIGGLPHGMPTYIALPEDETKDYEVFAAAFRGEVEGIDPTKIMPSKASMEAAGEMVKRARMDELTARDSKKGGR